MTLRRDWSGRPLLIPAGAPDRRRVAYTRASGLAAHLEDQEFLNQWQMRYLARGMAMSPDLCDLAASETYHTGLRNPLPPAEKKASAKRLDGYIERALDRMKIHEKADFGTAVHQCSEPGAMEKGATGSSEVIDGARAFFAKCDQLGIRIGGTELFVANDAVRSAGTFDHIVWHPKYGTMIGDKKTGKMNPHEFCVQLSVYAHAELYDVDTDQRQPLESLTRGQKINRDHGLIFWIHDGKCEVKIVDLAAGWEAAQHAAWARDYCERTDLMGDFR